MEEGEESNVVVLRGSAGTKVSDLLVACGMCVSVCVLHSPHQCEDGDIFPDVGVLLMASYLFRPFY